MSGDCCLTCLTCLNDRILLKMAQQIQEFCPICKKTEYFEWQIEREDTKNNNLDFWLMCCSCGYVCSESKMGERRENEER